MSDEAPSSDASAPAKPSIWKALANTRMLVCIFSGFSSGMPLYVLYHLIPAWLRDEGVDLKTIGLFSLIGFPYTWKFLWSPLIDHFKPPVLGRRRGWALITQVALLGAIAAFGPLDPTQEIWSVAAVVGIVAFFSASQDIVLDAHRRELLPDAELGIGNSMFVNAYRLSMLVPGSLALILADQMPWSTVHLIVAAFMVVGIVTTFLMPEPEPAPGTSKTFKEAVVEPFREFFARGGSDLVVTLRLPFAASARWLRPSLRRSVVLHLSKASLLILTFMLLYKIGDSMATALLTPFYLDLGFTKTQIGTVAKAAALWAGTAGATLGGLVMIRLGINRSLWCFGVVQFVTILGFALLNELHLHITMREEVLACILPMTTFEVSYIPVSHVELDLIWWQLTVTKGELWLFIVVSAEYLGVGLGGAAFVAYMARTTDRRYTATQFALLTSVMGIPRTFANASTGFIVEAVGWTHFYLLCAVIAVPGMVLLKWVAPWGPDPPPLGEG